MGATSVKSDPDRYGRIRGHAFSFHAGSDGHPPRVDWVFPCFHGQLIGWSPPAEASVLWRQKCGDGLVESILAIDEDRDEDDDYSNYAIEQLQWRCWQDGQVKGKSNDLEDYFKDMSSKLTHCVGTGTRNHVLYNKTELIHINCTGLRFRENPPRLSNGVQFAIERRHSKLAIPEGPSTTNNIYPSTSSTHPPSCFLCPGNKLPGPNLPVRKWVPTQHCEIYGTPPRSGSLLGRTSNPSTSHLLPISNVSLRIPSLLG